MQARNAAQEKPVMIKLSPYAIKTMMLYIAAKKQNISPHMA
jgi:hypothetical protein